jgi:lysozyme family protein
MAERSFEAALPHLFRHEGGYADHPRDPGGATKYGVTRTTLAAWRGANVTKTDVRRLTREEAGAIYKARYWDAVRGDDLPAGVDYCVFDAAVNSGPGRAAKWLQAAVRVSQDGVIGPKTLAAAAKRDPRALIDDVCDVRLSFLRGLSSFSVFGRGWERRVGDVRRIAGAMAQGNAATPTSVPSIPNTATSAGEPLVPTPTRSLWSSLASALVSALRAMLTGGRR